MGNGSIKCKDVLTHPNAFFIDDIHDNIIASTFLHKKTGIDCIINGRVWTEKQADALWGSEVYGISADTILGIEILHRNR